MKQPKGRILYFDVLNIIACMAVIFLHHNGLVHKYSPDMVGAWSQALFVEVVAFFCGASVSYDIRCNPYGISKTLRYANLL